MNKTSKRILILIFLSILLILYLINASLIIKSILEYTNLFFRKLFASNFIFFTLADLLIEYGLIETISSYLNINTASFYIFLMSLISGFPSGSKYTKELLEKNLISEKEANLIIMSTHFPNPLFVLGTVFLVLKSKSASLKIYLAIIISNLLIYLYTLFFKRKEKRKITFTYKENDNFSNCLSKAIMKSLKVIVLIYGTSLFFYLIAEIISKYMLLNTYSYILLNGFFDLTKGISSLTLCSNTTLKALLAIIFISFGGLSIHMQVKSIIADTKIKYKNFLIGRIIGTILALGIFLLLSH